MGHGDMQGDDDILQNVKRNHQDLHYSPLIGWESLFDLPDTCYTEGYEYSYEASVLHRQLKRAIMSGAAGEGLSAYRAMERYFPIQSLTPISDCQQTFISCSVCRPESKSTSPELKSLSL